MKDIIIITARAGFPNGFGATSIIRKYASGFNKAGYNVSVLLLRPSENKNRGSFNKNVKGFLNNSYYEYMCGTTYTSKYLIKRIGLYFKGVFSTAYYLFKNYKLIDRVFFYSPDHLFSVLTIQLTCIFLKIPCIGIKTESSFTDVLRTRSIIWKEKEKIIYKKFKSMFVITNYLKNEIKHFGYNGVIKVIPIIVDEDMFDNINLTIKNKTLVYVGTLKYEAEIRILLDSYKIVVQTNPEWELIIIGEFIDRDLECRIKEYAENLDVGGKVNWKGKLDSNNVAYELGKGGIMLLPRIKDETSEAGFPIKLGEYLLTKAPVVVTNTGEISYYLKNFEDAFIVEPNNTKSFADSIISVINNYEWAKKIGMKGRDTAIREFGSLQICKKMME